MPFELSFLHWLHDNFTDSHFVNNIFKIITLLGDKGFIWIVVGLAFIVSKKYRMHGILLLGSLAFGTIVNTIIKEIVSRPRPMFVPGEETLYAFAHQYLSTSKPISLIFGVPEIDSYSFASGHTYSSFNAAVIIYFANKKLGFGALILATLIGFSRMFFGVHYPTDVIAGLILGILTALLSIHLFKVSQKYLIKRKEKTNAA